MSNIDFTPFICVIATVVMLTITGFLIPHLRRKLTAEQQRDFDRILDILVAAAEQTFDVNLGANKLDAVIGWLKERGYKIDIEAIEAAVHRLHKQNLHDED
ncbi:hypothetical protein FACS1894184_03170 [Clostridia bacterium]|nr:hypothetical protein FACS1894184_03170 [Clostridia bacterium]